MKLNYFLIILFLFSCQLAYAVGISPPEIEYTYGGAGQVVEGEFAVIGSSSELYDIKAVQNSAHGFSSTLEEDQALVNAVELSSTEVYGSSDSTTKTNSFSLVLPELATPGPHGFFIEAKQKAASLRQSTVSAIAAVLMRVTINVPYPGKYLDHEVQISPVVVGEPVFIDLILTSRGEEAVNSINGVLEIYDGDVLVDTVGGSNSLENLLTGESGVIYFDWVPNTSISGDFSLKFSVNYDDQIMEVTDSLRIGSKDVDINLFENQTLIIGQINRVRLAIDSFWNVDLNSVYIDGALYQDESKIAGTEFTSAPFLIPAWASEFPYVYIPLPENLNVSKDYSLDGQVYFDDLNKNFSLDININELTEETDTDNIVGSSEQKPFNTVFLTIIIIGVIVFLITAFFFWKHGSKKDKGEIDF